MQGRTQMRPIIKRAAAYATALQDFISDAPQHVPTFFLVDAFDASLLPLQGAGGLGLVYSPRTGRTE